MRASSWLPMILFLPAAIAALSQTKWREQFDYSDYSMIVRSGVVTCYKAFYSTGCSGKDTASSTCDSCQGQTCFKIGGTDEYGTEAYNYGCVERFSSATSKGCVGTHNAATEGLACYCHDGDFCNAAAALPPPLALLSLLACAALR